MAKSVEGIFVDWLAKQQPEREYDYFDNCGCAFATFLMETGICDSPAVRGQSWRDRDSAPVVLHPLSDHLSDALVLLPHTYGALHHRLTASAVS